MFPGQVRGSTATGIASLHDASFFYKLDEASGNRKDYSTNANDATPVFINGGSELGNIAGHVGNAARFYDGATTNEQFRVSSPASGGPFDLRGGFTIYCWFYVTFSSARSIVSFGGNSTTYGFMASMGFNTASFVPEIRINGNGKAWGSAVSTATWHMLECGYDIADGKLFINIDNGTELKSAAVSDTAFPTGYNFWIGIGTSSSPTDYQGYYADYIQQLGAWKRRWTSTERANVWNSGAGAQIF
jgi:hypothetical protein